MTTPRLKSFELLPAENGWRSPRYEFGALTTLITGDNGAGKTPMLRALAVTLGAKIELPKLVKENCRASRLVLSLEGKEVTIERSLNSAYASFDDHGSVIRCFNEEDISRELMKHYAIQPRTLVARQDSEPVPPYMSILAPVFYVDQDHGWKDIYEPAPNVNFVTDQREEALRWLLDIPQRNFSNTRQERDEARRRASQSAEQLEDKRRLVESLRREAGDDSLEGARLSLEARKADISERLNGLVQSWSGLSSVHAAMEVAEGQARVDVQNAHGRLRMMEQQAANLQKTRVQLVSETSVLEANEIAAQVFRGFCDNRNCNLFRPQDSYGRRLLHLRDQLKDIDSTTSALSLQIELSRSALDQSQRLLDEQAQQRRAAASRAGGDLLVSAIEALTKEMSEVSLRLDRLVRLDRERQRLGALVEASNRAIEAVAALAGTRSASGGSRLNDARSLLANATQRWLAALNTRHVGPSVSFDSNLIPQVAGERFSIASSQSGSTRTRVVLALHAAFVETSIEMKGFCPPLLILDAPKQQELQPEDLAAFVTASEKLFKRERPPFQLVIGAKDQDIFAEVPSAVWEPVFRSGDGYHFLGE